MASTTEQILRNSEEGIFIGYGNLAPETGTKINYDYVVDETLDPSNIKYPYLDEPGRFTNWRKIPKINFDDPDLMYLAIDVELPASTKIGFIALCAVETNYPRNKYEKLKFQIFYDNSGGLGRGAEVNELTDGYQDLLIRNTGLDYFHPDFWFGYSKTLFVPQLIYSPYIVSPGKLMRTFRIKIIADIPEDSILLNTQIRPAPGSDPIELTDTTYYLDIGALFVGQYEFFEMNYGWKMTISPISAATPTVGNSMRGNYRGEFKMIDLTIPDLSESDFMFKLSRNILGKRPTFERFFIIPKPVTTQYLYDRAMLAVLSQPADQNHEYYDGFSASVQFRETN